MKSQRRRDLLKILHEGRASSQLDIVRALQHAGHEVTQATVSRDLQEVGATKVRQNGGFVYRLADDLPRGGGDLVARNLASTLQEFAISVQSAGSVVVVKTAPGHASAVARAIDLSDLDEVAGTIAGDDTIFVATAAESAAGQLARRWLAETDEQPRRTEGR
ncbi:MAG: arginine repressor [Actinomycetota bacterium]|nr:arginine repressor [Actinomycetota bacterium]